MRVHPSESQQVVDLKLGEVARPPTSPHAVAPRQAIVELDSDAEHGLSSAEAERRFAILGPNRLPSPPADPWLRRLLAKLKEPMSLLLIAAAAMAGVGLGERLDAVVILAIVTANATIAFAQESKAARSLAALKTLEAPETRVLRNGQTVIVPADDLVVGDVVLLAAGDRVPADLRLIEGASMEIDESLLTGESLPVAKDAAVVSDGSAPLTERAGMAFSGTILARGAGKGIVVATGAATELGEIARHLGERQPPTPLQMELAHLSGRLGVAALAIAALVFAVTLVAVGVSTEGLERSLLSAVALAVAAVPEGLATVVTVALALGVRRMADVGAIVRMLPAVETLGSTDVIVTDKTGTLTQNRLRVEVAAPPGRPASSRSATASTEVRQIMEIAVLCNDATLDPPAGDPLEVALLESAGARLVDELRAAFPRVGEAPFDSERKRMSTWHRSAGRWILLVKGAPESVIDRCSHVITDTADVAPLEDELRLRVGHECELMADRGMRVLAFARKDLDGPPEDSFPSESDLTLVGLLGLRDPLRTEAVAAVKEAQSAGIDLIMVTGDHPRTAATIAEEAGISQPGDGVVTGKELRRAESSPGTTPQRVYARVDPDDKLALVDRLRDGGRVVAVTGDGVNDVPALRRAHIGVAMGRSGTDAAREAGDMVITDDNLSTIVTAIREGRGIYDNIRKVVDYLVAANLSEILVVVLCLLAFPNLGVPLLPIQLLWINLLTDGLPALALGVDPIDPGVMQRPPRPRSQRLLSRKRFERLLGRGVVIAAAAVFSLVVVRFAWDQPWAHARAVMFTVLAVSQLFYAFAVHIPNSRRQRSTWFALITNRWLLVGVAVGLCLQLAVVFVPWAHEVFGTGWLAGREWLLVAAASFSPALMLWLLNRDSARRYTGQRPS